MDTKEILRDCVGDMLAAEKHCLESIERQTGDKAFLAYTEAHQLLTRIEVVLRSHTSALEHCLSTIDGGLGPKVKKALSAAAGAISGIYGKNRFEEPVSRSLRDDYTALNLVAISYTMLHTTACVLNEDTAAELALRNLNEITPLIVGLSRVIPEVLAYELSSEDKALEPAKWRQALENTQNAWSHNVIGEIH